MVWYLLSNNSSCTQCGKPVGSSYIQQLQQIANNNTLANNVGTGIVQLSGRYSNMPQSINGTTFTVGGKPEILYVGGEFCPFCAVTRWSLVIALMRFGTFSNFTYMESSATDMYADTPTFSFTNYSYTSDFVHFNGFEVYNRTDSTNILTPTGYTTQFQYVTNKYSTGGIPFSDFFNRSIQSGAMISPHILHGQNWNDVLQQLQNSSSVDAQGIIATANIYTAYICKDNATINATAPVCKQKYVKDIIS